VYLSGKYFVCYRKNISSPDIAFALHGSPKHSSTTVSGTPNSLHQLPHIRYRTSAIIMHTVAFIVQQTATPCSGNPLPHLMVTVERTKQNKKWKTALNGHQLILVNGPPTRDRTILVQCSPNLPNASAVNLDIIHLSNSLLEAQQKLNDTINTHFAPVRCAYGAYNYQETKNEHGEPMYGVQLYLRQTDKMIRWELWQITFAGE
jgi:hypothetical protein